MVIWGGGGDFFNRGLRNIPYCRMQIDVDVKISINSPQSFYLYDVRQYFPFVHRFVHTDRLLRTQQPNLFTYILQNIHACIHTYMYINIEQEKNKQPTLYHMLYLNDFFATNHEQQMICSHLFVCVCYGEPNRTERLANCVRVCVCVRVHTVWQVNET